MKYIYPLLFVLVLTPCLVMGQSVVFPPDWFRQSDTIKNYEADEIWIQLATDSFALSTLSAPKWWTIGADVAGDSTDVTAALQAAIDSARVHDGIICLDSGTYYCTDTITVIGVVVKGRKAKVHFETAGDRGGFRLYDGAVLIGLEIDVDTSTSSTTNHGGFGTAITIGDYNDGIGYHDIGLYNLTIHGPERIGGNGIFITGHTYNVHGNGIRFINCDSMGIAYLQHWGEPSTGKIIGDTTTPLTKHPHNIIMENVTVDSMPYLGSVTRACALSGSFNTTIRNWSVKRAKIGCWVYAGDFGYRYSDSRYYPEIDADGILIENFVVQSADSIGFWVNGIAGTLNDWMAADSTQWTADSIAEDMPVVFRGCQTHGDTSSTMDAGVWVTDCNGPSFWNCVVTGHSHGFVTLERTKGVTFTDCDFHANRGYGASISYGGVRPQDIKFYECEFYNNNLYTSDAPVRAEVWVNNAIRTVMVNCTFGDSLGNDSTLYGLYVSSSSGRGRYVGNHVVKVQDTAGAAGYRVSHDSSVSRGFYHNTVGVAVDDADSAVTYFDHDPSTLGWIDDGDVVRLTLDQNNVSIGLSTDLAKLAIGLDNVDTIGSTHFDDSSAITLKLFNSSINDSTATMIVFTQGYTGTGNAGILARRVGPDTVDLEFWTENANSIIKRLVVKHDGSIQLTNYTLPVADGSANHVLVTDGSGNVSFAASPGKDADSVLGYPIQGTITDNYIIKLQISGSDTTWQIEEDIQALPGGADMHIMEDGVTELSATDTLDFRWQFDLTNSGIGLVTVYLDTTWFDGVLDTSGVALADVATYANDGDTSGTEIQAGLNTRIINTGDNVTGDYAFTAGKVQIDTMLMAGDTISSLDGNALQFDTVANELDVAVDDATIEVSGDALKVVDGGIGTTQIATSGVETSEILDGTIAQIDMANNSIGAAQIIDGGVGVNELSDNSVGNAEMQDNAVGQLEMRDTAVGTPEILDGAITTGKVLDATLLLADLAQNGAAEGKIIKWVSGAWAIANDSVGAGSGTWTVNGDSIIFIDADLDTIAIMYDDDAGNVRWKVGNEDQTLSIVADTGFYGAIVLQDGSGDTAILNVGTANPGRLNGGQNDAQFGDSVSGKIGLGNVWIGQSNDTTFNGGLLNLNQTAFWANMGSPASLEFAFFEANGDGRFAIPSSGPGLGTNAVRSFMCAGPWVWHDSVVIGTYWGFDALAMNTGADGADLGVQNNVQILDTLFFDSGSQRDTITATEVGEFKIAYDSSQFDNLRSTETAADVDTQGTEIAAAFTANNALYDNFSEIAGAVTDGQVPNDITIDEAGDLSDTLGTNLQVLVTRLDTTLAGHPIDTITADLSDGDVLQWVDGSSEWQPVAQGGAETDPVWVSDSGDYLGKNVVDDSISNHLDTLVHQRGMDRNYFDTTGTDDSLSVLLSDSTSAAVSGDILMDTLSAPTYVTLKDWWDVSQSAMITGGGTLTQDVTDSTVIDIAAGDGIIKTTDSDIGENVYINFGSGNNIAVTDLTELLVYIDYNGGSPIFGTTAAASVTFTTQVVLGRVYRNGNHMHLTQGGQNFTNFEVKNSLRIYEIYDLHRGTGLVTSEGADASNDIDVSAGAFYLANNRQALSAVASFTDNIELFYGDGAGGFTAFDTTALDDGEYDDGDGTKASLTTNRYNIFWVFIETDGELIAVYDSVTQSGGYSLGAAQAKTVVTTLPMHVPSSAIFIAKIIVQESAGILSTEFPWDLTFAGAATADHGNLAGLGDDDHTQYLKESDTNAYSVTVLLSADTAIGDSLDNYFDTATVIDTVDGWLQDKVASNNTQTRITLTYQSADSTIDFVVDDMNDDVPEAGDYTNLTAGTGLTHSPTGTITHDAHTGDVTGATALTIGADKVLESHLKAVNAAVDEDIATYEATTGDFEWHTPAELGIVTSETDPVWVGDSASYGAAHDALYDHLSEMSGTITDVNAVADKIFYSDNSGDITEVALGADGTYLESNGTSSVPSFTVPPSDPLGSNPFVAGALTVTGPINHYGHEYLYDTANWFCEFYPYDTVLIRVPAAHISIPTDSFRIVHPDLLYAPGNITGYNLLMVATPLTSAGTGSEDICLWGTNVDSNNFTGDHAFDSVWTAITTNPIVDNAAFGSIYTSDPCITMAKDSSIALIFRISYAATIQVNDIMVIRYDGNWVDTNGSEHPDTTTLISGFFDSTGSDSQSMQNNSPSCFYDTGGIFTIITVEDTTSSGGLDIWPCIWQNDNLESQFSMGTGRDTVRKGNEISGVHIDVAWLDWEAPNAITKPWHASFDQLGPDFYLCTYFQSSHDSLFMSISRDNFSYRPIERPLIDVKPYSFVNMYQTAGWLRYVNGIPQYEMIVSLSDENTRWSLRRATLFFQNPYEWVDFTDVYRWIRPLDDSVYLWDHIMDSSWNTYLFYNIATDLQGTPPELDTFMVMTENVPQGIADSVEMCHRVSTDAEIIDMDLRGPSFTVGGKQTDTSFWSSSTDITSTSWDTLAIQLNSGLGIPIRSNLNRFGMHFIDEFGSDDDTVMVEWLKIRIRKNVSTGGHKYH